MGVVSSAEPQKGEAQKAGILGSISGAYGRYKERAAERKVQGAAVMRAHCGVSQPGKTVKHHPSLSVFLRT
jgi:hypothetical protein